MIMNSKNNFDIADEIFKNKDEDEYLIRKEVETKYTTIKETIIKSDNNPFNKEKGLYTTIEFDDLYQEDVYLEVKRYLEKYLKSFIKELTKVKRPSILIVGIGNEEFSPDALGPKVIKKVFPTSHLDDKRIKNEVSCIIPGVMGVTGLESFMIVKGILNEKKYDLLIVIDSLTTHSISRLNHVIQITDTGLTPGSGINNKRKAFNKNSLKVPVISLGIATVISLNSIYQELINALDINKRIKLNENDNIYLTIKEIESRIELLTTLISDTLNTILIS